MQTLLVLIGMQGSGKTTALQRVKNAVVLKPSTQRLRRVGEGDDYHFETDWNGNLFAWEIERNGTKYGMRQDELKRISSVGVTVFDPTKLDKLTEAKSNLNLEVISVGIDTIATMAVQHQRVSHITTRQISTSLDFEAQRKAICNCDVVLQGNVQVVANALNTIISIVAGRGGLLHDQAIRNLIEAGILLEEADPSQIKSASYDLRLADMYWCQGDYITLDSQNPTAAIPPYSYILVQAVELASLPRFVAADFGTTVSLFLNGIILSNGPQVDPGYKGALFCMLYNASDTPMGISRGQHFATIQFSSTVGVAQGYAEQYQDKKLFQDFLDAKVSKSAGGQILERLKKLKSELKSEVTTWRNAALTLNVLAVAVVFGAALFAYNAAEKASEARKTLENLMLTAIPPANNPGNNPGNLSSIPDTNVVPKQKSEKSESAKY